MFFFTNIKIHIAYFLVIHKGKIGGKNFNSVAEENCAELDRLFCIVILITTNFICFMIGQLGNEFNKTLLPLFALDSNMMNFINDMIGRKRKCAKRILQNMELFHYEDVDIL